MDRPNPSKRAVVVAGSYPAFGSSVYVRHPLANSAEVQSVAFAPYRQREVLNFLIGREAFRLPTQTEVDRARASMRGRAPWPSAESVYLVDDILVILLEDYRPDLPVTITPDYGKIALTLP